MLFPTPSKTPKYRQPSSPSQAMLATVAKERPDGFLSRSHDLLPRERRPNRKRTSKLRFLAERVGLKPKGRLTMLAKRILRTRDLY